MSGTAPAGAGALAETSADVRAATRDLVLVLADSKRLLGTRYAGWILGAPELEAGIACASMAQDEWGHGRLLYALLREFGEDVDRLEHGREPAEYRSMQALDEAPATWLELIVLNVFVDAALTVQLEALRGSGYAPLRQRVAKMLEEERFHAAHGAAWFRRLVAATPEARAEIVAYADSIVPLCFAWFGPDSQRARRLHAAGVVDASGADLRQRYADHVAPLLALIDYGAAVDASDPDFTDFDESTRRSDPTGPDAATVARVRGDRNRAFLMD